ncbi:MAG TPA: hypothetical protein PLQ81_08670, partial [bacterium]|nr:hypothetical protein [bacterium]
MTWKLKVLKTNHILIVLLLLFSNCGGNNGDRAGVTEVGNPNVKTSINGVVYNYSKKGNIKPVGGAVVINQSGDTIGISDANGNYAGSLLKSNNEDFLKVMINGYIFQTAKINKNNDTIVCNFKLQETDNNPATLNSGGLHYSSKNNTSPKLASSGAQATIVSGDGLIQLTVQNGWSVNGLEAAILATAYNEIANINNLPSFRNKFILDRNKNPDIVCGGQIEIKKKINDCYAEGRLKNSDINWNGNVDLICAKSLSKNLCDWKNYFNDSKKKLYLYFLDDNGNWQYKSTARIIDIGGVLYCAPDTSCFLNGFYDFLFATEQSFNITISGYVKDKFTNLPIPNVEVIIPELAVPVLTDNSGRYSIEASMPFRSGSLTLHFIKSGYTYQN